MPRQPRAQSLQDLRHTRNELHARREQAKARDAAIVGIFHDESVRTRVADRLHPMGTPA